MSLSNADGRRAWIDAVRALCVIAIVLMHFQLWVFDPTMKAYPDETRGWYEVTNFLAAFRMPALFAVSGLLVSSRIRRGWSERRNTLRAASSFYLYAVWLTVYAVFAAVYYWSPGHLVNYVTQILVPHPTLWFILFLAINVVVLTTLHRVHPALVLGALAALSVWMLAFTAESPWEMLARGTYYMLFFAIGVYFKSALTAFASGGLWWKVPATIILLIVVVEGLGSSPFRGTAWFGLYLARDVSAVFCAVAIAGALTLVRPISVALSYLGRRTLTIYVLHVPIIWVVVSVRNRVAGESFDLAAAWSFGPALGVAATITASLLIGNILSRFRFGRALFRMPHGLEVRILEYKKSQKVSG